MIQESAEAYLAGDLDTYAEVLPRAPDALAARAVSCQTELTV